MSMLYYVFLTVGVVSCAVFNYYRVKEGNIKALLLKAFTSVCFVGCALSAAFAATDGGRGFALLVIAGLMLGLMGDIWLDLKWIDKKNSDAFTFAGFGSFMLGHFCFIGGLLKYYADFKRLGYLLVPALIALLIAAGVIVLEKPMKMKYGKFKLITFFYGFVLSFMTLLSGSLALMNSMGDKTLNLMLAGGVFFLISDLILSGTYFGVGKDRPVDIVLNHVTYYAAQFLIASAVLFI